MRMVVDCNAPARPCPCPNAKLNLKPTSPMANALESELQYPHTTPPLAGQALVVAPGVKWVRMGLPFALDHINLWLLRDRVQDELGVREGWTLVDCGLGDDVTRQAWERVFENELEGLPVLRVVVTHMHPDHIGSAAWLTERWQCRLWISATDFTAARLARQPTQGVGGEAATLFFHQHGLVASASQVQVRQRTGYYASMVPELPTQYRRIMDGQTLMVGGHAWHCISGYGHAPEHIALHAPSLGLLISGDMVLPRISTNVMVVDIEPEADPLTLYLDSIRRFLSLPSHTLVLPSHGLPFVGLHERVRQLIAHHDERFAMVLAACAERPMHATDLLPMLFRRTLDGHQMMFAMGESIAHLHALWHAGALRLVVGDDGMHRFTNAATAA